MLIGIIDNFIESEKLYDFERNYVERGHLKIAFTNGGDDRLNLGFHGFTQCIKEKNFEEIPLVSDIYKKLIPIAKGMKQKIHRWHFNLAPPSFDGTVHPDYATDNVTFIFCSSPEWHFSWGGELILYDKDYEAKKAVSYKPGRLIMINGSYPHRGLSAYRLINRVRTTIAFQTEDL